MGSTTIWPIMASFFAALSAVLVGSYLRHINPVVMMCYNALISGGIMSLAAWFGFERLGVGTVHFPSGPTQIGLIVLNAILSTATGFCYFKGLTVVPPFVQGVVMTAMPGFIFGISLFLILFGVQAKLPTAREWICFVLICSGVIGLIAPAEKFFK